MAKRRVVITGCGPVTPIGIGKENFWEALKEGKNGVALIDSFDTSAHSVKIAAEVRDFDPTQWLDKKEARRTDRSVQLAFAASALAIEDSGIDLSSVDKIMFGVYVGCGEGGLQTAEDNIAALIQKGPNRVSPFTVPMMIVNMPAAYIAIKFGAKGPNMSVETACATGLNCIIEAYNCIERGDADVMLAGGTEACVRPLALAAFSVIKALSTRNDSPETASRPFDKERDGFVIGEGAGIVLLEEYEHAVSRGAHIYGEITGYGITCDAYHITAPDPDGDGAYRAMAMALKKSGWQSDDVDLINAHGTSTAMNDKMETAAIYRLLGNEKAATVLVHSTKSMIGHLLGAAGGTAVIASLLAVERGIVHPTINQFTRDPECGLNTVPNKYICAAVNRVLINGFGFGGHNAVVAIEKCR